MSNLKRQGLTFLSAIALSLSITLVNHQLILAQTAQEGELSTKVSSMNIFQGFILGIVQGLTEFLPISSTAHLKVIPVVLGWGDPGVSFTAIIQLGSIVAVISYFWTDLRDITLGMITAIRKSDYKSLEFRLALGIGLGTIPILFFGLLLKIFVPDFDNSPLRSLTAIAIASIVMASLLAVAEKVGAHKRGYQKLRWQDGVIMGLAQALALIPGVSRSGSTITSGLLINLDRATAARFSFLLGIPAITLAGLVELKDVFKESITQAQIFPLVVGVVSSAVFSYLAIAWLLRYLQKQDMWVFVWYRLIFGGVILGAIALGFF